MVLGEEECLMILRGLELYDSLRCDWCHDV